MDLQLGDYVLLEVTAQFLLKHFARLIGMRKERHWYQDYNTCQIYYMDNSIPLKIPRSYIPTDLVNCFNSKMSKNTFCTYYSKPGTISIAFSFPSVYLNLLFLSYLLGNPSYITRIATRMHHHHKLQE